VNGRGNGGVKTIGFGHAPEHEQHHFVVAIPRAQTAEVMIYEVFERDLVGPELIAANLRCRLDRGRWLKIVDALEEEFNGRLRTARMKTARFKAGDNPIARLLGKELVLLAWAVEAAEPTLIPNAIQNWRGLVPEERWWLYTMTAAATGLAHQTGLGWRGALRHALCFGTRADTFHLGTVTGRGTLPPRINEGFASNDRKPARPKRKKAVSQSPGLLFASTPPAE
jgi:hypothetical protein